MTPPQYCVEKCPVIAYYPFNFITFFNNGQWLGMVSSSSNCYFFIEL